jgi:hypothetical protein
MVRVHFGLIHNVLLPFHISFLQSAFFATINIADFQPFFYHNQKVSVEKLLDILHIDVQFDIIKLYIYTAFLASRLYNIYKFEPLLSLRRASDEKCKAANSPAGT